MRVRDARPGYKRTVAGPRIDVSEDAFDDVYPESVRRHSARFWTPVEVAEHAAAFLAPEPSVRVLDVGSGAGKFCIVGAATTGASFSGVEHRARLVAIAHRAARSLRVAGTAFTVGTIEDVDWSSYDAFYLFNPFGENFFREQACFDRSVVLSDERFGNDVAFVEQVLALCPVGTRVATFNGFGGRIPKSYELVAQHPYPGAVLRFWTRVSPEETYEPGILEATIPVPEAAPLDLRL